ncbi:MAG: chaperone modulator CbpM [Lysobacterales bacterium]|jgi:chaperone modulatory protein CbpM
MADSRALRGQLVEEETVITLEELCRSCTIQTEEVVTLVREGVIDPADAPANPAEAGRWQFHIGTVRRVRVAMRLQRDLGVNLPGAALALELLDRIEELKRSM